MNWTIVGLGNPGNKYTGTRHNIGFEVVDTFRQSHDLPAWGQSDRLESQVSSGTVDFQEVMLLKPQTYMNKSGVAVKEAAPTERDQERLIVVHDDIDLPLSQIQIAYEKSAGGHNGVGSIIEALGTNAFARLRFGIAPSGEDGGIQKPPTSQVREYVLSSFPPTQKEVLEETIPAAVSALETIITDGKEAAMNEFHE